MSAAQKVGAIALGVGALAALALPVIRRAPVPQPVEEAPELAPVAG
jgi:hypothetical protein